MTNEPPQRDRVGPAAAPLYDAAFEHDACGDRVRGRRVAAGRRDRVLPLALGGLAALAPPRRVRGRRRVVATGPGVSLPLDRALLERSCRRGGPRRPAGRRPALPAADRAGARGGAARRARGRCPRDRGPRDRRAGGACRSTTRARRRGRGMPARRSSRRSSRRPVGCGPAALGDAAFERRLVLARRRLETAAREAGLGDAVAVPSASCRTIVYKGLVAGARLADLYPDLRASPIRVRYAIFHQRYATNTQPTWRLAQPFRSIAHNGEINTVRGNRAQVRGRAARSRRGPRRPRELVGAGPLLSPDGSDSQSLDELPRAARRDRLGPGHGAPHRDARGAGAPPRAASPRRDAPPPDRRPARAVGRARGDRLRGRPARRGDRRPQRPPADRLRGHARPARRRRVARPARSRSPPADTVRRGRLGPGELLLVDPARGLVLEDGEAKAHLLRRLPIHDAPRPAHLDPAPGDDESSVAIDGAPTPAGLRFLAGLHAENARLDIKTMALEGHEPLWSMGDDTPTPGLGRIDRPIADHLRQAFAQVTNPPIDPERERAVMDLRVELGRRSALLGGPPARIRGRSASSGPYLADLAGARPRLPGPGPPARRDVARDRRARRA